MPAQNDEATELIQKLLDDATVQDIMDELYFKEQVERGLRDVDERRVLTHAELRERMAQWRTPAGR